MSAPSFASLIALVVVMSVGCSDSGSVERSDDDGPSDLGTITSVSYRFRDASVAPEYHRSVDVDVDESSISIVISSYGDELDTLSAPTPADLWADLQAGAAAIVDIQPDPRSDGCVGGSGRSVEVVADESFEAAAEDCGGSDEGVAEIDDWIRPVIEAVPGHEDMTGGRSPFG